MQAAESPVKRLSKNNFRARQAGFAQPRRHHPRANSRSNADRQGLRADRRRFIAAAGAGRPDPRELDR